MPKALPPIPPREDIQMSDRLSVAPLLQAVRKIFSKIPEHRAGNIEYSLVDTLMSGAAVFGLKFPSLLKFDENLKEAHIRHNLQTLYGVAGTAPCDTQMRKILDPVDPEQVSTSFDTVHRIIERNGILQEFKHMGRTIVLLDATGEYSSNCTCAERSRSIGCPDCCTRTHADGTVEYYHQMLAAVIVHPDKKTVLPLAPEPIIRQKDATKNDCETCAELVEVSTQPSVYCRKSASFIQSEKLSSWLTAFTPRGRLSSCSTSWALIIFWLRKRATTSACSRNMLTSARQEKRRNLKKPKTD